MFATGWIGANAELQVFAIGCNEGASGKITTFTVLLSAHNPGPAFPELVDPQSLRLTYLAFML
jgi:hypothetical protein